MNGIFFVIPIILVRYLLLGLISKEGLKRASFFPPVKGKERLSLWIYQLTIIFLLCYPIFFQIKILSMISLLGLLIYLLGLILYIVAIINFTRQKKHKLNTNGLYKISRNPMYVAFFIYFLGISVLVSSIFYFFILILFQISVHYLILSEERWCIEQFGVEYKKYMRKVRRYI